MKKQRPPSDKPYNKCLPCQHRIEKRCDGPRTSAMPLARWCEFMRDMKIANGLTNQEVAERSGVSIKTIERIMAQNCDQDIMRETARRIEDAVIGSSNQYPCYLAFEEANPTAGNHQEELDALRAAHEEELRSLNARIADLTSQLARMQRNNDYLWEENNRKTKIIDKLTKE